MIRVQAMMAAPFIIVFLFLAGTLGALILIQLYNFFLARANKQKAINPNWSFLIGTLLVAYLIIKLSIEPSIN